MISPASDLRLLRPFGLTLWTVIAPALAVLAIGLGKPAGAVSALVMGLLLGAAIMAAVYHAEILAHYLGEPFGTLVLAVAVTVIEVSLIVSIMLGEGAQAQALARDTLIAAIMITINAIVGICLLAGGRIHHEQSYTQSGVSAGLAMLATLSVPGQPDLGRVLLREGLVVRYEGGKRRDWCAEASLRSEAAGPAFAMIDR